jgi:uncharacterized protein YcbX
VELSAIHLYPIKGAAGIALGECEVDGRGLAGDRRYMLVGPDGKFLSQRTVRRLALVRPRFEGDAIVVEAPDAAALWVPRDPEAGPRSSVTVWRSTVDALDAGPDAAAWFTAVLGTPARLVYMPDDSERLSDPFGDARTSLVGFADGYPFLLANESSLADLQSRAAARVPMDRFRPNLVVRGAPPWAEDDWRVLRIGEIEFDVVKGCERCSVTTVDQRTGEVGKEPLATLAKFRAWDGKVWFASNLVHRGIGRLRVGDRIAVEG